MLHNYLNHYFAIIDPCNEMDPLTTVNQELFVHKELFFHVCSSPEYISETKDNIAGDSDSDPEVKLD